MRSPLHTLIDVTKALSFTFSTGIYHAIVIGSSISQFSQAQVYVFLLVAFVYFSFLTVRKTS